MVQIASRDNAVERRLQNDKVEDGATSELVSNFQYLVEDKDLIPAPNSLLKVDLVSADHIQQVLEMICPRFDCFVSVGDTVSTFVFEIISGNRTDA